MSVRSGGQLGPENSTLAWSIAGGGLSDFTGVFPGGTTDFSTLGPFDYASSIRSAFAAWSAVANIQFIQVLDPGTEFGGLFGTFPDIRIGTGTLDTGGPGFDALGMASFPGTGNEGYVWINSASSWNPHNLFMVTLHELGHSLGLDHELHATAVMNPANIEGLAGLQADDIAGIQGIYGAQDNLPPVYTMPADKAILTIVTSLPLLTVNGNSLNNVIAGTSLNETFFGKGGNDTIDGGGGLDTAGFSGSRANYSIGTNANGSVSVTDLRSGSPDGKDTLSNIELLQFADRTLAPNDPPTTSRVERFFDSATGDHFYTLSAAEANQIRATLPTYHDEGAPWGTPDKGADTIDLFRFYDSATGAHFLTTSTVERDFIIAHTPTLHFEGVAFESYTAPGAGTLTLERFFNTISGLHHYSASAVETASINGGAAGPGWVDEGAGFIVHT
ncbi:hypothetical protein ACVWZV_004462 [Bradyrhizobium sp. GM5.1]